MEGIRKYTTNSDAYIDIPITDNDGVILSPIGRSLLLSLKVRSTEYKATCDGIHGKHENCYVHSVEKEYVYDEDGNKRFAGDVKGVSEPQKGFIECVRVVVPKNTFGKGRVKVAICQKTIDFNFEDNNQEIWSKHKNINVKYI